MAFTKRGHQGSSSPIILLLVLEKLYGFCNAKNLGPAHSLPVDHSWGASKFPASTQLTENAVFQSQKTNFA